MKHSAPRPNHDGPAVPFDNAEQAWMWSAACSLARLEGARIIAGAGSVPRPCEPVDIQSALQRLHGQGRIDRRHVDVLVRYGRRLFAPDSRGRGEADHARLWDEALDALTTPLQMKGIVWGTKHDN